MKAIFTLLLTAVSLAAVAQTTFVTYIHPSVVDAISFKKHIELSDGSFICAGEGISDGTTMVLAKLDAVGRVINSLNITGTLDVPQYNTLSKTSDDGFVIGAGLYEGALIAKYSSDMTLQWQQHINIKNSTLVPTEVYQKTNGSYVVAIRTYDYVLKTASVVLVTLTADGKKLSSQQLLTRPLSSSSQYAVSGIAETKDGNYILLAAGRDEVMYGTDTTFLMKVTPAGNTLWVTRLTSPMGSDAARALTLTDAGDIIITGQSLLTTEFTDETRNGATTLIAKFNGEGVLQWQKHIDAPQTIFNSCDAITEDRNGNYMLAGTGYRYIDNLNNQFFFNYFISITPDGSLLWTRKTDEAQGYLQHELNFAAPTADGGYAACGTVNDATNNQGAGIFYKFDSLFASCTGAPSDSIGQLTDVGSAVSADNFAFDSADVQISDFISDATTIGSYEYPCNNILPVQLLSFSASLSGKAVDVKWTTTAEVNASSYTVERSSNGNDFSMLTSVSAKGNYSGTGNYKITDVAPLPGVSYYRLQQTDKNGRSTYSAIVKVLCTGNAAIVVYPNPVQNTLHVLVSVEVAGKAMLLVTDITGKAVITQNYQLAAGTNAIDLPAVTLGKGVYIVRMVQNNMVQTVKIIKQ